MTIFSILTMIGGLAFFLFGMNIMSSNLEKVAGGKLEVVLHDWVIDRPGIDSFRMHAVRTHRTEMREELLLDCYDTLFPLDPLADQLDVRIF